MNHSTSSHEPKPKTLTPSNMLGIRELTSICSSLHNSRQFHGKSRDIPRGVLFRMNAYLKHARCCAHDQEGCGCTWLTPGPTHTRCRPRCL